MLSDRVSSAKYIKQVLIDLRFLTIETFCRCYCGGNPHGSKERAVLTQQQLDSYIENGFVAVPGLLPPDDVARVKARATDIAADRVVVPGNELAGGRRTGVGRGNRLAPRTGAQAPVASDPANMISDKHARRGQQVYPVRQRAVEDATRQAAVRAMAAAGDPWVDVERMAHLIDHDDVFRAFSAHPNIVAVLQQLLGPNIKSIFDHLFYKGPYDGHNRYHQDGFFEFSDRACTAWIALHNVTAENGCMRYIPDTAGYGQFKFDQIADGVTPEMLAMEVLAPVPAGGVVFHDRWTLHATGPNETPKGRAGWAVHYASAKSRFIYDPTTEYKTFTQTPDGRHLRDDEVDGNMQYRLVSGREFPGCI